jgi:hypothetical protein
MLPKTSASNWTHCETIALQNSTAIIWHTGAHYRAKLEIDHPTQKALSLVAGTLNLSVMGDTLEEVKERAARADSILGKLKGEASK